MKYPEMGIESEIIHVNISMIESIKKGECSILL